MKPKTTYTQRVTDINARVVTHCLEPIDIADVQSFFESNGSNDLAFLSTNNGLNPEENRRLFETPHIAEMVYLVLNGLQSIGG